MKVFAKIFTSLTVMLSLFSGTAVADSYDVFVPIAKYLGNVTPRGCPPGSMTILR